MTISSQQTYQQTPCNGTTTQFSFPNKIFSAFDLVVTLIDPSGNLYAFTNSGTNTFTNAATGLSYTVYSIDVDTGCYITFSSAPTNLWTIDMRTSIAELQSTSIKNQSGFFPELHEEFFDKITREMQDLRRLTYTFGIHGSDNEAIAWPPLPAPAVRAGGTSVWDTNGLPAVALPGNTTSAALVPFIPSGTGAVATNVAQRLSQRPSVFDFFTAAQQNNVALNIGSIDVTIACQAAVNAAAGTTLDWPAGKYLISSPINITNGCKLQGVKGLTTILLGTQNQNGFVVGDGTIGTRSTAAQTTIDGFSFNPSSTVAAFTSGSCVVLNYVEFVYVTNCFFYGSNGTANILYNGVSVSQATDPNISNNYFYNLLNYGLYASGGASAALRTVNGRFDFNEFTACGNDCVHLDANCAGITVNFMIAWSFSTWGIVINANAAGLGTLFYIAQPDIEADGSSGAIYIENASNVDISGGWVGTSTFSGTTPSVWVGASSNSVKITGLQMLFGRVQIDGPATTLNGCDVVGDNVASTMAVIISATATDTNIIGGTIRQHVLGGIQFSSTPPATRCQIDGVRFKNCGPVAGTGYEVVGSTGLPGSILGASGTAAALPPVIGRCQSDVPFTYAAAGTGKVVTSAGRDYLQVTASANITIITPLSIGNEISIQAGAGGITLASGGNIQLKTSPTTIASGAVMSFVTDGINMFENGRNF
jgi:hypothetical protein